MPEKLGIVFGANLSTCCKEKKRPPSAMYPYRKNYLQSNQIQKYFGQSRSRLVLRYVSGRQIRSHCGVSTIVSFEFVFPPVNQVLGHNLACPA